MPYNDPQAQAERVDATAEPVGSSPTPRSSESALLLRRPTILGLARLGRYRPRTAGGLELYRHIARMIELGPELEFMVAPCGRGGTVQFLVESTDAAGAGVDPDRGSIEAANAHALEARLSERLHFEQGRLDDLPYQDEVFDAVIGEIGVAATEDPAAVIRELVRVTKPMGTVVLIQFTWTGNVSAERKEELIEMLGVRPLLLVEWKQLLRAAGVVDLYVEDWSDPRPAAQQPWPLGGTVDANLLMGRIGLLFRAWRRWGWRGFWLAVRAGHEMRALLTQERILGLTVIKGTKWQLVPDQGQ